MNLLSYLAGPLQSTELTSQSHNLTVFVLYLFFQIIDLSVQTFYHVVSQLHLHGFSLQILDQLFILAIFTVVVDIERDSDFMVMLLSSSLFLLWQLFKYLLAITSTRRDISLPLYFLYLDGWLLL